MLQDVTQKNFNPESLIAGLDEREIKLLVLRVFNHRCAICNRPSLTVHEIIPRARGKKAFTFRNRITICNKCHEREHHFGASAERIKNLQVIRAEYLVFIGRSEYV